MHDETRVDAHHIDARHTGSSGLLVRDWTWVFIRGYKTIILVHQISTGFGSWIFGALRGSRSSINGFVLLAEAASVDDAGVSLWWLELVGACSKKCVRRTLFCLEHR